MDLDTKIALQNAAWQKYRINVPDLELCLRDFETHVSKHLPALPADIPAFLDGEFAAYLEPIPGFVRTKSYSSADIEKAVGALVKVKNMPWIYQDQKFSFYWAGTDMGLQGGEVIAYILLGDRLLNPEQAPSNRSTMRRIITIDCHYLQPQVAAAFLMIDGDRAAFIENNTTHSVPYLLDALKKEGLSPEQVEYLIITHVHLDHAGGSSALMAACPSATLLAHPRAAPHVIDPSKLVASARKVYGDDAFEKLYGKIESIPASRVRAIADGEEVMFGSAALKFMHTRGHANHHMCILDEATKSIFTGDSFGLAYPALQSKGLYIFPSTSPTDFLADEAISSVKRIRDSGAETAFLTHFGPVQDLKAAALQLIGDLEFSEELLIKATRSSVADRELDAWIEPQLRQRFQQRLNAVGLTPTQEIWDLLKLDIELNAQGLAHVARKKRAS